MLDRYALQSKSSFLKPGRRSFDESASRVEHGGNGWSPSETARLRQPQDGAQDNRSRISELRSQLDRAFMMEPEDARLTGGTRSLMRRLMGLNITPRPSATIKRPTLRATTETIQVA